MFYSFFSANVRKKIKNTFSWAVYSILVKNIYFVPTADAFLRSEYICFEVYSFVEDRKMTCTQRRLEYD
jgi:hypothetical protein